MVINDANKFQAIISHAKEYGFVFQSSEIYDGLSAVYDYGPWGSELKKNIREAWWNAMTRMHDNIVGIDAAIFMHPTTWKASGHVDNFSDPMIDNKDSKKRYRVDHLIEASADVLVKEGKEAEAENLLQTMEKLLAENDFAGLKQLIDDNKIKCSVSNTCNWTEVRQFNLMFSTQLGSVAEDASEIYLRPETARQFIFRMREFEQMEMQFFIRPGTQKEWYAYWKEERMKWHTSLGFPVENYRYHDHVKLAHYADAAVDIEYAFPIGWKEVEGIHSRTDFDLKSHQQYSGKKLQYFDPEINQNYVPYVIETSIGLDRMFLLTLCHAYQEEKWNKEDGSEDSRVVLKIPAKIAPIKLAVLPLLKKEGLPEIAKEIMASCRNEFYCFYEEKDTIGKRYRRMDALGTPFCVTIDHQTKEDRTVTIRYRDTMQQERFPIEGLAQFIKGKL